MDLSQPSAAPGAIADPPDGAIAVVVLTHNRRHLVQKCVENVLLRTSEATREIVIWDNASTDGTAEYLATLEDPRIRVVRSERNIGQNGYARAFRQTTAPYLIEVDDDVVDAPEG
jgi:GT2 family glycosyltransferase